LHNYHDNFNTTPPGSICLLNASGTTYYGHGWTWHATLLPYIDRANLYNEIQGSDSSGMGAESGGSTSTKQRLAGRTVITVFQCPSHPDASGGPAKDLYATSNYNGNMGTLIGSSGDNCYSGSVTDAAGMAAPGGCLNADGIFFPNSSVAFRDVTDGLSNTIFVSEVIDSGGDTNMLGAGGSDRKYCFSGGADGNPPSEMTEYLIAAENNRPHQFLWRRSSGQLSHRWRTFCVWWRQSPIPLWEHRHESLSSTQHKGQRRSRQRITIQDSTIKLRRLLIVTQFDNERALYGRSPERTCFTPRETLINSWLTRSGLPLMRDQSAKTATESMTGRPCTWKYSWAKILPVRTEVSNSSRINTGTTPDQWTPIIKYFNESASLNNGL